MASQSNASKRKLVRKWVGSLLHPNDDNIAASRPASQASGGSVSPSASAQPSRTPAPTGNNQTIRAASPTPSITGQSAANSPTQGAAPAPAVATNTNPGPTATDKLKQAGNNAWSVLEATLRVLEKSADAFPPLKSAVGGFIACLDMVQTAATNREEYKTLADEVDIVANNLKEYVSQLGAEGNPSIARLVLSIQAQVEHIEKKRNLGSMDQVIKSTENKEDVIKCYRKVGSLFLQLQHVVTLRIWKNTDTLVTEDLLKKTYPVDEARHNSSYARTIKRRECTKDTREKVQKDLQDWVQDPNGAKVYWMNGMAGTGKTTIAYSLSKWLETNELLGASFFCSRALSSCDDFNRIVPTIAYRLARYSPAFRSSLCAVLNADPDISKLDVVDQFQKLIEKPMQYVKNAMPENVVVVIDALDECKEAFGARLILQMLLRFSQDSPLKFFITSRPDPTIVQAMQSQDGCLPLVIVLHNIEQSLVRGDIKKYLTEALGSMSPPPSDDEINQLVKRAGKLFIYAATVARYICPEDPTVDPSDRLQTLLLVHSRSSHDEPSDVYNEIDALYTTILISALNTSLKPKEIESRRLVLWTVICLKEPLTIVALAALLGMTERKVSLVVQSLQSVLHMSEDTNLVSTLHSSFPDYIFDQSRSNDLYCNPNEHHKLLADRCFIVMQRNLRFNICQLKSSAVFDQDVPDLSDMIDKCIPPMLFYACINWSEHLQLSSFTEELRVQLVDFLSDRLLFWMEVLNLQKCGKMGMKAIRQAQSWLKEMDNMAATKKQLADCLDCLDFVTRFFSNACALSTPHIYVSALSFQHKASAIHAKYRNRAHAQMNLAGTTMDQTKQDMVATWKAESRINTLALSKDDTHIITGSGEYSGEESRYVDCTIRVWDAQTGNLIVGSFEGHTAPIHSVALSPDGARIVSGSGSYDSVSSKLTDCTVRVWDAHTSTMVVAPFEGHTAPIHSVAFSPGGTRIVSGSGIYDSVSSESTDCTIRVWDAHTGNMVVGPFKGHTAPINSVAFSPDGARIVSGSGSYDSMSFGSIDCTVRVWDAHTSTMFVGPLIFAGHTAPIHSVAFSPDGGRIVSGSGIYESWISESTDCTIRVWDAHTGNIIAGPFEGHTAPVNSVAFSPDGARIVSGSGSSSFRSSISTDCTIRVWDAHTGSQIAGLFGGHMTPIHSIAFSPDGGRIVSGSLDGTIHTWDPQISTSTSESLNGLAAPPKRKLEVRCAALSPDGARIVSGSGGYYSSFLSTGCTIQVRDAHTGNIIVGSFAGHTVPIHSVAFSPDGARIVSGSGSDYFFGSRLTDCVIQVWDAHTGNQIAVLFEGHTAPINSVAFSPDGTRIVSGSGSYDSRASESTDCTIRVWDAHTGNMVVGPFKGHTTPINSVAFSPDGTRIVSGSGIYDSVSSELADCTVRVWDTHTGNIVVGPLAGHTAPIHSVAFSPDGTCVVSGSGSYYSFGSISTDCTIRVWDAHTGNLILSPFAGHTAPIHSVAFSPDGTRIVSGSGSYNPVLSESTDCTIRVWDVHTGSLIAGPFHGHTGPISSVAFSPTATHIFSTSRCTNVNESQIRTLDLRRQGTLGGAWSFQDDGWVTASGLLVFWLPPHLRGLIFHPEDCLVIGERGSLRIDNENFAWGERWTECYSPSGANSE